VTKLKPRQQGDIGELSAMEWLTSRGAHIYVPVGHSPDIDLVAEIDGMVLRVEVKTATRHTATGRWDVTIATRGGNQSWSGVAKYFDRKRCDYLFVHVGDGRRWFIPSGAIDGRSGLVLGGQKYSDYEVEKGRSLTAIDKKPGLNSETLGEYGSGQTGGAVNAMAQSFGGSNPPSPIASSRPVRPTNYERRAGQRGEAVINQKRRLTIPQRPFFEAGFANGGKVRVRADGPGRLIVEQTELPAWAREPAETERRTPG
jgi:Holliday junction resolvase-like predicted endonuclease